MRGIALNFIVNRVLKILKKSFPCNHLSQTVKI